MLLQYTPDDTQEYVDAIHSLFKAVHIDALFRADTPHGTLLQIDTSLRSANVEQRTQAAPLVGNLAYTGWIRDTNADRLFSASRGDALSQAPSLQSLAGEFSFANLGADGAVAATDHYATQPVYYRRGPNHRLIVASDLRLVLAAPRLSIAVCEQACVHFLSGTLMVEENEPPEGLTFFDGVRKLPPGSLLTADYHNGNVVVSSRGDACVPVSRSTHHRRDYAEAFRQILNQCVRDRLAAGADALLLSGGIDSSTVLGACLASGHPPPLAITMGFEDPDLVMSQDDKLLAALFAQRSLPHRTLFADRLLRLPTEEDLPVWVDGPDPSANPLIKQSYACLLQQNGASGLVMTGEGGDAILGEAMHEWIVDAIRANEGIRAAHRYVTRNCGHSPYSRAYYRYMLSSIFPQFAYFNWQRSTRAATGNIAPPYLLPRQSREASERSRTRRNGARFPFVGHHAAYDMLFPRAAYFDSLSGLCIHSHPFLDPRMIAFALSVPPHVHHNYERFNPANPYATSKHLARSAYRDQLPAFVCEKTHKTSYALMARRMFQNSSAALYRMTEKPMLLHQRGMVDQPSFRRHLLAYIVATEDPNANLGINYHFIRGVTDLETWLRQFSGSRAQLIRTISIRPLLPVL
jgi:asparagine synthase (glutamine-hydrolysing)